MRNRERVEGMMRKRKRERGKENLKAKEIYSITFTHKKPSKLTHHEASWSRPFLWEEIAK